MNFRESYERQVAQKSTITSTPWQEAEKFYDLPAERSGVALLDVGAGSSSLVPHLLTQGADAYALDPFYGNYPRLKEKADRYLANQRKALGKYHPLLKADQQAFQEFEASFRSNPDRFVAGHAADIPTLFPRGRFRAVVSSGFVFQYLDLETQLLLEIVDRMLNITQPGGTVQLHGWKIANPILDATMNATRMTAHETLHRLVSTDAGIESVRIKDVNRSDLGLGKSQTLIITKRGAI